MSTNGEVLRAAEWLRSANSLLITVGAGMGVDSGLPDFRGTQGFWRAYPALQASGLRFEDIASPDAFRRDPAQAWGFYGHRLELYRRTQPHRGFRILRDWAAKRPGRAFVFTSNVDGHFQAVGFPESDLMECHGSIHWLQCLDACSNRLWPAGSFAPQVDTRTCRLLSPLPRCPSCGGVARPNILMFNDSEWIEDRTLRQERQFSAWLARNPHPPTVLELGAGRAIRTVRRVGEYHAGRLIRINPREFQLEPAMGIGIAGAALEVLELLDEQLRNSATGDQPT